MAKNDSMKKTSKKTSSRKTDSKKKTSTKKVNPKPGLTTKASKKPIAGTGIDKVYKGTLPFEDTAEESTTSDEKTTGAEGKISQASRPAVPISTPVAGSAQNEIESASRIDVSVLEAQQQQARRPVPGKASAPAHVPYLRPAGKVNPTTIEVSTLEIQQQQFRRAVTGKVNPARVDVSVLEQRYQKGRR